MFACAISDIIERFGRFPQRNKALGRESTREENRFLKEFTLFWIYKINNMSVRYFIFWIE